jgi:hypothetical protein
MPAIIFECFAHSLPLINKPIDLLVYLGIVV